MFLTVVPWLLGGLALWLLFELAGLKRRVLVRLDTIGERLQALAPKAPEGAPAPEVPLGDAAPEFELPDLDGRPHALAGYRGRPVLLLFVHPGCPYCAEMAGDLAKLPPDGGEGRPVPILLSSGSAGDTRAFVEKFALRCPVLLQPDDEVARRYGAAITPMGYLVDAEGKIASPRTVGGRFLLALAAPCPR